MSYRRAQLGWSGLHRGALTGSSNHHAYMDDYHNAQNELYGRPHDVLVSNNILNECMGGSHHNVQLGKMCDECIGGYHSVQLGLLYDECQCARFHSASSILALNHVAQQ